MVYRRRVVEDRNPMGPILAVIAVIVLLFLAWMLFRDDFGIGDDGDGGAEVGETTTPEPEEPAEQPVEDILPGEQPAGDAPATGDAPGSDGGDAPGG